uniref:Uncharacterized protein n=1 Tax=Triticum urartu TaxID=4572 RepID=A0A8R7NZR0_TRIUA
MATSTDEERRGGQANPDAKYSSGSQHKDKQRQQHLLPFSPRTSSSSDHSRCSHAREDDDAHQQYQLKAAVLIRFDPQGYPWTLLHVVGFGEPT